MKINNRGSVLIGLVFAMVIIGTLGGATLYLTSGSTFSELSSNNQARAYYMAESGVRFATPLIQQDINGGGAYTNVGAINNQTYTLNNGDRFALAINVDLVNKLVTLVSTGTANPGGWLEGQRRITSRFSIPTSYGSPTGNNSPSNWDPSSTTSSDQLKVFTGGPNAGDLNVKGDTNNAIGITWDGYNGVSNSYFPNLINLRSLSDNLLSYEMQTKMMIDYTGGVGNYHMIGLSFRLNTKQTDTQTDDNAYGVSFFRAASSYSGNWLNDLDPTSFSPVRDVDGNLYIIFWKKQSVADGGTSKFVLLDYKPANAYSGLVTSGTKLVDWPAMAVRVVERYKTSGGNRIDDGTGQCSSDNNHCLRENLITLYVKNSASYPKNTLTWDFSTFNLVYWVSTSGQTVISPQTIVDDSVTLTTLTGFPNTREEIGLNVYFDNNGAGKVFFDDFAVRSVPGGSGSGGVQY